MPPTRTSLTVPPPHLIDNRRNRIAWRICNFALRRIATAHYRGFIEGAIRLGLETAARDPRPFEGKY